MSSRSLVSILGLSILLLALLSAAPVQAGTIDLAWDPVTHPDLVGYRVHWGTSAGTMNQTLDVSQPSASLTGLADCTTWYVGVTARASDGSQSATMSNLVNGWPRPRVLSAAPASLVRGATVQVVVGGSNFQSGATVDAGAGLTVGSTTIDACGQLTVSLTVASSAALGARTIRVTNPDQVYGEASGLLAVVDDSTGPTLSSIQVSGVGATTATVSWTSSEPSDGTVLYHRNGETAWQTGAVDATLTTSHSLVVQGLEPQTSYSFQIVSTDAAGNATTQSVGGTSTTTSSAYDYLRFEPEDGPIGSPAMAGTGTGSLGGGYVELEAGTPRGSPSSPSGSWDFGFYAPSAGTWQVWLRMRGTSPSEDAWLERVDGAAWQGVYPSVWGNWEWVEARSWTLAAGQHVFGLGGYETGVRVDRVLITDDPAFVPTEGPGDDVVSPPAPQSLVATAGDGQVLLEWTDPSSGGAVRVVARYRTDGVTPTSPVDGEPLADDAAAAGTARTLVHDSLTNGVEVRYALFMIDASGNVSTAAAATAIPQVDTPPIGTVQNVHRTDRVGG